MHRARLEDEKAPATVAAPVVVDAAASADVAITAEVLGNGFVVLRNALDPEMQKWLAEYAVAAGRRPYPSGWYDRDGTALNATATRGRIYDAITSYPESERIRELCLGLVDRCRVAQPNLPQMEVTHMLLLLYTAAEGMDWHRDSDKNDGDNDHPIVSVSLGNSTDFGYKPLMQPTQSVRLDSGDVAVWGGPQRMLEHCVLSVHSGTCPEFLRDVLGNSRINFTFRSAPNILGRETEFATAEFATHA